MDWYTLFIRVSSFLYRHHKSRRCSFQVMLRGLRFYVRIVASLPMLGMERVMYLSIASRMLWLRMILVSVLTSRWLLWWILFIRLELSCMIMILENIWRVLRHHSHMYIRWRLNILQIIPIWLAIQLFTIQFMIEISILLSPWLRQLLSASNIMHQMKSISNTVMILRLWLLIIPEISIRISNLLMG